MDTKVCGKCGITKPLSSEYYQKDASRPSGFYSTCKLCKKAHRLKHIKAEADRARNWRATHQEYLAKNRIRYKSRASLPSNQKCSIYNCKNIGEIHHIDYTDPFAILYVCSVHHAKIHTLERLAG